MAVDRAHIYWVTGGAIGRANLDGTGVDPNFIPARTTAAVSGLAVDGEHVYWLSRYSDPEPTFMHGSWSAPGPPNTGAIGRANLDGTGVDNDFISGISYPGAVAVDGPHVYWSGAVSSPAGAGASTIGRANLDGTEVDPSFIVGVDTGRGMAVDGAHVYWTSPGTTDPFIPGGIGRANLDGTGVDPSFIAESAIGVAVDVAHVYWGGGGIGRANLDGTGIDQRFISELGNISAVAVDDRSAPPSNKFRLDGVKVNKKRGSAKLTVDVPVGPGELKLARNPSVKGQYERVEPSAKLKLSVKAKGSARKRLNRTGKAKVKARVTYTPDGGTADTKSKRIKLVKR